MSHGSNAGAGSPPAGGAACAQGLSRRFALGALGRAVMAAAAGLAWPSAQARGSGRGARTVRLYRRDGRFVGRIEPNGRHYDAQGRYQGVVRGQRLYDAKGRYLGRFEESGAFWGPQETASPQALPPSGGGLASPPPQPDRRTQVLANPPSPARDLIEIVRDPAASAPRRR